MSKWNILLLDKSGSMSPQISNLIKEYNNLLNENNSNICRWTIITFNDNNNILYDGCITNAQFLRIGDIIPKGKTALYDAIGNTFNLINESEQIYNNITLNIITDGLENSSKYFDSDRIILLKTKLENEKKLKVYFMGATDECLDKNFSSECYYNDLTIAFRSISNNISNELDNIEDNIRCPKIKRQKN